MGETMNNLFVAVRHNLLGLGRFAGRDTPAQFWPYVGLVFALLGIVTAAVMLPPMASTVARMHRFAVEDPGRVAVLASAPGPGDVAAGDGPALMPNVQGIIQPMILLSAIALFLLAAAVVRRLHDRDRSGIWAALPVAFLLVGLTLMPRLFRNFASAPEPDLTLFYALFANNLLYLLSLLVLVAMLVGPGTKGPNRYGPDPRDFAESPRL